MEERTTRRRTRPGVRARDGGRLALGVVALAGLGPCAAPIVLAGLAATGVAHMRGPAPWLPLVAVLVLALLIAWRRRAWGDVLT